MQAASRVVNDPGQFRKLQEELREKRCFTNALLRATFDALLRKHLDEMDRNCQLQGQMRQKSIFQALQPRIENDDSDIEEVTSDDAENDDSDIEEVVSNQEMDEEFQNDQGGGKMDNKCTVVFHPHLKDSDCDCPVQPQKRNQSLVKEPHSHLRNEDSDVEHICFDKDQTQSHQTLARDLQPHSLEMDDSDIEEVSSDEELEGDNRNHEEGKVDDGAALDFFLSHGPDVRGRTVLGPRSLHCKDHPLGLQDISQLVCDARVMSIDVTGDNQEESKQAA